RLRAIENPSLPFVGGHRLSTSLGAPPGISPPLFPMEREPQTGGRGRPGTEEPLRDALGSVRKPTAETQRPPRGRREEHSKIDSAHPRRPLRLCGEGWPILSDTLLKCQ